MTVNSIELRNKRGIGPIFKSLRWRKDVCLAYNLLVHHKPEEQSSGVAETRLVGGGWL